MVGQASRLFLILKSIVFSWFDVSQLSGQITFAKLAIQR
jgi:hypothetical protein